MMSILLVPLDSWLMTSDSANTVQVELMATVLRIWPQWSQVRNLHFQDIGHNIQETASTGGAFIVHLKLVMVLFFTWMTLAS